MPETIGDNLGIGGPAIVWKKGDIGGGDIDYAGGDPTRDATGERTAIHVHLYTEAGYWGNLLTTRSVEQYGAAKGKLGFQEISRESITSARTTRLEAAAEEALAFLKSTGRASFVRARVISQRVDRTKIRIEIQRPNGLPFTLDIPEVV